MLRILKYIALFILLIVFATLVLELSVRIFYPAKVNSFFKRSPHNWLNSDFNELKFRSSKFLGYEFVPKSKIQLGQRKYNRVNSLGMIDKERVKKKAKNTCRIICIGDSVTACSDYANILELLLNNSKNNRRFEVWNCGVPGYGIFQYCRALKEKWLKYDPDMIIIGFCLNDFDTTPLVVRGHNRLVGYFPEHEIVSEISPFLLKYSAVYRLIQINRLVSKDQVYNKNIIEDVSSYLKDTKNMLATRKIPFLIVIFGLLEKNKDYPLYLNTAYKNINKIAKDYNIETIDMMPIFETYDPVRLRQLRNDNVHLNPKGSQVVANAIYDYLNHNLDFVKK